ncbi:MAG: cation-translocating P-type ATPase [Chloroflexi bacterium]|nr:cation-translocating P-type ATPase [Chloroflexota bacterium]
MSSIPDEEENCFEVVSNAVADQAGIVDIQVDTTREQVAFEYDPDLIADADIVTLARKVEPTLRQRFDTCTLRLAPQTGRSCEACAMKIEHRMNKVQGVRRATASYMGGVLSVTYDNGLITPDQIMEQVKNFGVKIEAKETEAAPPQNFLAWFTADRIEAIFTAITFITMFGGLIAENLQAQPIIPFIFFAIAYFTGSVFGLKGGLESLRHFTIDVDLLMVLAAAGAWVVGSPFEGAMLLFLFSLSNVLQAFAMDRTRNAIKALMKLRPNKALIRRGGRAVILPIEKIIVGDVAIVRPGERIQQGGLEIRVTKLAKDSTIAKLIILVEEAHSEKAKTQRTIDKFEQYYALGVIIFTALAIIVPIFIFGEKFNSAFYRAMVLMVSASPCALVISTPASILSAIGNGARKGVLFKGGVYLEEASGIKVVAFDKTGTLTLGKPQVTDVKVISLNGDENELLKLAASVEAKSEHPLAQAIVKTANARGIKLFEATVFQSETGKGVRATVNRLDVCVGSLRYFESFKTVGMELAQKHLEQMQDEGKTSVAVARLENGVAHLIGTIGIADVLRKDSADVIRDLKSLGVEKVIMLTGDHDRVAQAIAKQAGVDEYYAGLLPEDKLQILKKLEQQYGRVAMVGDGVNDAPALAAASVGIAMGAAGTDVALETADVVLMSDDLTNIPYVIALSRKTQKTLFVNLAFSIGMIVLLIITTIFITLPLPLAVIGHEGSTVLVSLNGLRLLAFKRKKQNVNR